MTNNEILQLVINTFELTNSAVVEIFSLADFKATEDQVADWLTLENDDSLITLSGTELAVFLNGFINLKRGKREGEQPKPQTFLNNNMVFQKLRIALDLKTEDILEIFRLVDVRFSKHEITSFFRKPNNDHYRECLDNTLQNFLQGVQSQLRPVDDTLEP